LSLNRQLFGKNSLNFHPSIPNHTRQVFLPNYNIFVIFSIFTFDAVAPHLYVDGQVMDEWPVPEEWVGQFLQGKEASGY
jgi:hypothetical protein